MDPHAFAIRPENEVSHTVPLLQEVQKFERDLFAGTHLPDYRSTVCRRDGSPKLTPEMLMRQFQAMHDSCREAAVVTRILCRHIPDHPALSFKLWGDWC